MASGLIQPSLFALLLSTVLMPAVAAQAPNIDDALDQAQVAQAAGHFQEAAAAYAEATRLDPSIPELWANRGLMEHLAGQPALAITSFQHALAVKPGLFTALLFTGVDHAALNQPQQAVPFLEHALRLQPSNPDALIALGKSFLALGRLNQAADTLEKAVLAAPANSGAWFSLATTRLAFIDRDGGTLAKRHTESAWSKALYAEELLVQGRLGEAEVAFRQAVSGATAAERALFAAVLLRLRQDASTAAETAVSPSLQGAVSPGAPVPLAREAVDRVLAIVQPQPSAVPPCSAPRQTAANPLSRASCSYLEGDAKAAAAAVAALTTRADDPEALFWSVKANEQLSVEALSTFERLAPQSAATFDLMGDLYRRRLQPDRALDEYSRALAVDATDAPALLGSAAAYLSSGRPDQAIAVARLALQAQPESPRLNLLMGEALVAQHHFTDAQPFVERCLIAATSAANQATFAGLLPSAFALRGQIKADTGDLPGAIADLTLGLPSDADGSLSFQLSRLYRREGQTEQAKEAETRARALLTSRRARAVTAVSTSLEAAPNPNP